MATLQDFLASLPPVPPPPRVSAELLKLLDAYVRWRDSSPARQAKVPGMGIPTETLAGEAQLAPVPVDSAVQEGIAHELLYVGARKCVFLTDKGKWVQKNKGVLPAPPDSASESGSA